MDILQQLVNDIVYRDEEMALPEPNSLSQSFSSDNLKHKPQKYVQKSSAKFHKIQISPGKIKRPSFSDWSSAVASKKLRSCCVDGCDEVSSGPRRFFKFPDAVENSFVETKTSDGSKGEVVSRRRHWELKLLDGASASDEDLVCSNHFETKCLKMTGNPSSKKFTLDDSAIPTLHLPDFSKDDTANEEEIEEELPASGDSIGSWSRKKTLCLLERWAHQRKPGTTLNKNPLMWTAIAEDMQRAGFPNMRGASCYLRIRYLLKRYEECKKRHEESNEKVKWRYYYEIDDHLKNPSPSQTGVMFKLDKKLNDTPIVHMKVSGSNKNDVKLVFKEDVGSSGNQSKPVMLVQSINSSTPQKTVREPVKSSMARLLGTTTNPPASNSSIVQPRQGPKTFDSSASDVEEIPSDCNNSPLAVSDDEASGSVDMVVDFEPDIVPDKAAPPKWFVEFVKRQAREEKARAERDSKIISLLQRIEKNTQKQVEIFSKLRLRSLPKKTT